MYKKSVSMLVVLLLVLSSLTLADNEEDTCTGFSLLNCFFFGDASKRPVVGSAWYDRSEALVRRVAEAEPVVEPPALLTVESVSSRDLGEGYSPNIIGNIIGNQFRANDGSKWRLVSLDNDIMSVEFFNPSTNSWHEPNNFEIVNNNIFLVGDEDGSVLYKMELNSINGILWVNTPSEIYKFTYGEGITLSPAAEEPAEPEIPEEEEATEPAPSEPTTETTTTEPAGEQEVQAARTQAKTQLGDVLYGRYESLIDWSDLDTGCTGSSCLYFLQTDGLITSETAGGITTIEISQPPAPAEETESGEIIIHRSVPTAIYYRSGDTNVISQISPEQIAAGTYTVPGFTEQVSVTSGNIAADLASPDGLTLTRDGETVGWSKIDGETNTVTTVNSEDDTAHITNPSGDYQLSGSTDAEAHTFEADSGTWTRINNEGETERYTLDYDSNTRGLDELTVSEIELFDSRGRFVGVGHNLDENGIPQVITRVIDETTVELTVRDVNGLITTQIITVDEDGNVIRPESDILEIIAPSDVSLTELIKQDYDEVTTAQDWQQGLSSVYAVLQSTKSYPALNNLLWGDAEFYKDWQKWADQTFAPLLAENWFPSWVCEGDKRDIEPEGVVTLTTPNGIDQMVASIQAERSPKPSPMLCQYNQDEDLWFCEEGQVCWEDGFCYEDISPDDDEPDEETPMEGYFYKITWGAGAPQDEALTPFIDENGVAVSFNVWLYPEDGSPKVPYYRRGGNTKGPIELANGDSDQDVILKYSTKKYSKACLVWDKAPRTFFSDEDYVEDPCMDFKESTQGQVSWENSGQPESQGVTTGSGDVPLTRNSNW